MLGTEKLLARIPPSWLLWVGEMEHRHPAFKRVVRRGTERFMSGDRTIGGGVGAGLRFNAEGGVAGYSVGVTELTVQHELQRRLKPGDVVYDVGASIGFLAVICARLVGPAGRVIAFEPSPPAAARLRHNVAINGFDNVDVLEVGVADVVGAGTLVASTYGGESGLAWARAEASADGGVPLTTIDEVVAGGTPAPALVKLDIEGGEVAALRGMTATLAEHRPVVLCEIHDTMDEVTGQLEAAGYAVRSLSGEGLSDDPLYGYVLGIPSGA